MTPLDRAAARGEPQFHQHLMISEMFLALEEAPSAWAKSVTPLLFPVEGVEYAVAFDSSARLAEFVGGDAPFIELSGRAVLELLGASGLGLGVNLASGEGERLLSPEIIAWLLTQLERAAETQTIEELRFAPPARLPDEVLEAIDARGAAMAGWADAVYLASAEVAGGGWRNVIVFVGADDRYEAPIVEAIREVVALSEIADFALDVSFLGVQDAGLERLSNFGLKIDLPVPEQPDMVSAPGRDPLKPPRLR